MKRFRLELAALAIAMLFTLAPTQADAFCGFYVGGAGTDLFNDATQVIMMRDGTKTVLSMQNRYEGPVEDFALVIPVPEVLMEANVKTLDEEVFQKADVLSAPRLVEYFEEDPCAPDYEEERNLAGGNNSANNTNNGTVTVEAQFKVGEYEIVILSATESTGLETWLTENQYNIPAGAAPYYQPYIESGMYFFVARVDSAEVTYEDGKAVLSPLRFDYDSDTFSLPIRLGMINSAGEQDLIVQVLARNQRYEVANYPNVTIPTNIEVTADTKDRFGEFYKTLFARTLAQNDGAVVTEYAWNSATCDPCPGPTLDPEDILTLGGDVIGNDAEYDRNWVITRLHARYAKDEIGEDLVFQAADPIAGGREFITDEGELEEGAVPSDINNFQGRYIIRHPWMGDVDCEEPTMDRWGPPQTSGAAEGPTTSGADITASSEFELAPALVDDVPEIGVTAEGAREGDPTDPDTGSTNGAAGEKGDVSGCAGCSSTPGGALSGSLLLLVGALLIRRRRRE